SRKSAVSTYHRNEPACGSAPARASTPTDSLDLRDPCTLARESAATRCVLAQSRPNSSHGARAPCDRVRHNGRESRFRRTAFRRSWESSVNLGRIDPDGTASGLRISDWETAKSTLINPKRCLVQPHG